MKIASWNVNSLKARREHVEKYLAESGLDILMVQELKGEEFPAAEFKALGWETLARGQKAYNGVAIFSKIPLTLIHDALPGDDTDEQARYLEFEAQTPSGSIRLIDIYLPNGNPVLADTSSPRKRGSEAGDHEIPGQAGDDRAWSEKFTYKLNWMQRLYERLKTLRDENIPFAIGGDFNVIPEDKDCYNPKAWEGDALFQPESRAAFRKLLNLGLYDAFRALNTSAHQYTFWDYQAGRWQKDEGIRIDHFLLSPELADKLVSCEIDRNPRGWDKASDHTPIIVEIAA